MNPLAPHRKNKNKNKNNEQRITTMKTATVSAFANPQHDKAARSLLRQVERLRWKRQDAADDGDEGRVDRIDEEIAAVESAIDILGQQLKAERRQRRRTWMPRMFGNQQIQAHAALLIFAVFTLVTSGCSSIKPG